MLITSLNRELLIIPAQLYLLWTPSRSSSLSSLVRNQQMMLGAAGGWGRGSHRNSPLKCPDLSEPRQFSKTLPALWSWSVPRQAKVWGLDSLPVLEWSTPHPGIRWPHETRRNGYISNHVRNVLLSPQTMLRGSWKKLSIQCSRLV